MQNVYHDNLVNVDEMMLSDKIDHVMNSFVVSLTYKDDVLSLNLSLCEFVSSQRSFFFEILSLFRRYVTNDTMLFAFDFDY